LRLARKVYAKCKIYVAFQSDYSATESWAKTRHFKGNDSVWGASTLAIEIPFTLTKQVLK